MYECNAMQPLETREKKHKTQRTKNNGHKGKTMKHKDHVRKTQLIELHPQSMILAMSRPANHAL